MLLLLDNFDSFTYNLRDYLAQLGLEVCVMRNNCSLEALKKIPFSALVISPGPGRPQEAGVLMEALDYYHKRLPILGVCLGHQAIGEYFGAKLERGEPVHGKVRKLTFPAESTLFKGFGNGTEVVRYNSLLLETPLPEALVPLAYEAHTGALMALRHRSLPLWGVQFHPEAALTQGGLRLLKNWWEAASLFLTEKETQV